jgi:LysM repeat protein/lysophospholipase L1-like esterase
MKIIMKNFLFTLMVVCGCSVYAQNSSENIPTDTSSFYWLRPDMNIVQFYNRSSLEHLHKKWKKSKFEKVSVVMLGDSHLQHGAYPDQLRKRLHEFLGDGGKGLMFAYSAANTYSNIDYKTSHKGVWTYSKSFMSNLKLPLGVSGMAVRTEKLPANLNFSLKETSKAGYTILKIFFKKSAKSFDINLEVDGQTVEVLVDTNDTKPFVEVKIPAFKQNITLNLAKNRPEQKFFEFYGISLETEQSKGAILHNGGVGAAKYNSVLRQELFSEQLPFFQPDLVIIDFGTNDYLMTDRIEETLEEDIRRVVEKVRKVAPEASILLTTAQDLYWRKVNIKSGLPFSEMIHRVATETNCAVYDWYWVAGGQTVMRDWVKAKIAQNDMVHLNEKGYRLKGDMLFEALKKTMLWMDLYPYQSKMVLNTEPLKKAQAHLLTQKVYAYDYVAVKAGKPAPKKDTTNNLATEKPVIPVVAVKNETSDKKEKEEDASLKTKKIIEKPTKTVAKPKQPKTHTVKYGDTLYGIASKYRVSVNDLMKWNKLTHHTLSIGKVLIVKP